MMMSTRGSRGGSRPSSTLQQATVPVGQTAVLSLTDLVRIKSQIHDGEMQATGIEQPNAQQSLRATLREKSQARVANWGNTLEAQRSVKEAKLKKRADDYEAQRRRQDAEEALFQARQRREAIEKARSLLFEDVDRVKTLNAQKNISDAMMERQKQIEIRKAQEERAKQREEMWHQKTLQQIAQAEIEEQRKADEARQRAAHAREVQTQQLEEMKAQWIAMKLEEKREGELIRAQAEKHILDERKTEAARKERERLRNETTMRDNRILKEQKRKADAEKAAKEEARIQKFAQDKEEKMRLRAERMKEIADEKQAIRQRMIDRQVEYLQSLQTNEEKRIADQVKEADEKRKAMLEAKEEARRKAWEAGRQFNQSLLDKKAADLKKSKEDEQAEMARLRKMFEQQKQEDLDKEARRRQRNKELQKFHVAQAAERRVRSQEEQAQIDHDVQAALSQMAEEDESFKQYAFNLIRETKEEGKDPRPLIVQLHKQMKVGLH